MKKLLVVAVLLVAGAVFAQQTQDLGELAKKEKERRESLAKEGKKSKVYTAEDLERVKDKLALESTGTEGSGEEGATEDQYTGSMEGLGTKESTATSDQDSQKQAIESELQQLKDQRDELVRQAEEARTTLNQGGGGALTVNPAVEHQQVRESQEKVAELNRKIQEAEGKLKELEKKAEEDKKGKEDQKE